MLKSVLSLATLSVIGFQISTMNSRTLLTLLLLVVALLSACGGEENKKKEKENTSENQENGSDDQTQEPLSDEEVYGEDSLPDFDKFTYRFPHKTPEGIVFRHKGYTINNTEDKKIFQHGVINPIFVHHFLKVDSSEKCYYVMRLMPEENKRDQDTLVRLIYGQEDDFFIASFHTNGDFIARQQLTKLNKVRGGNDVMEYTYLMPSVRRFDTYRAKMMGKTPDVQQVIAGRMLLNGKFPSYDPFNYGWQNLQQQFKALPVPHNLKLQVGDELQLKQALDQRLHPGFVLTHMDTAYRPNYFAGNLMYAKVYVPYGRLVLPNNKVGIIYRVVEHQERVIKNEFILYTYNANGSLIMNYTIGSMEVDKGDRPNSAIIEDFSIDANYLITVNRTDYRRNHSGELKGETRTRKLQITPQGRIVVQS